MSSSTTLIAGLRAMHVSASSYESTDTRRHAKENLSLEAFTERFIPAYQPSLKP